MLKALVLVCSLAATPDIRDCTPDNAVDVLRVPGEFTLAVPCFMQGQAYLAETSIAGDLREGDRIKIVCDRTRRGPQ
jgi:hypothetical protein